MACARSVPTSDEALSAGYMSSSATTTIEPAPTEVRPTMRPATAPRIRVGIGRMRTSARVSSAAPSPSGSRLRHICTSARTKSPTVASSSAQPSSCLSTNSRSTSSGTWLISQAPAKAIGTEPTHSHATRRPLMVPCRKCTAAPTGFMNRLATMSLEMAVRGSTPKTKTSIGVMRAPPPMPVSPTMIPTSSPPMAIDHSMLT